MSGDDLLRMLDLGGRDDPPPAQPTEPVITPAGPGPPSEPAGPTALEVDAWGSAAAESNRLRALSLDEFAVADFHGSAFDPDPKLLEGCADPLRHAYVQQLLVS